VSRETDKWKAYLAVACTMELHMLVLQQSSSVTIANDKGHAPEDKIASWYVK
jgi:hypothetical protein